MTRRASVPVFAILIAATGLAGCGPTGPEVATVEGTVTLDGDPLPGATVVFTPADGGRPSGADTNEQGYYELSYSQDIEGALPGEHTVQVTTYKDANPGEDIEGSPETLPAKYNQKSELKKTVKPGESNVIDLKLESGGQVLQPPGL